jgi:hypothetical protein
MTVSFRLPTHIRVARRVLLGFSKAWSGSDYTFDISAKSPGRWLLVLGGKVDQNLPMDRDGKAEVAFELGQDMKIVLKDFARAYEDIVGQKAKISWSASKVNFHGYTDSTMATTTAQLQPDPPFADQGLSMQAARMIEHELSQKWGGQLTVTIWK